MTASPQRPFYEESATPNLLKDILRNYRLNRSENSPTFSRMFKMAKKIKELFTFTLNGIAASVRCVSTMIVVLHAK